MPLENPFFLREMRQTAHRPLPVMAGLLALAGSAAFFLLLVLHFTRPGVRAPGPWTAALLLFPHTLMSLVAGAWGANRIFVAEHRRGTLEGLFLLPATPREWLLQHLAYPLYLVLLAWIAPLPVYGIAVAARLVTLTQLERLIWLPAAAGLTGMMGMLLFPPDFQERMKRLQIGGGSRQRRGDADLGVRGAIIVAVALLAQIHLLSDLLGRASTRPFYTWGLPTELLSAAIPLSLFPAAAVTALATASRGARLESAVKWVRVGVLLLLYYLNLGLLLGRTWGGLPAWAVTALLGLGPGAIWWAHRRAAPPKEDPRSQAELERIASRWSNALLVKDLRVFTRLTSLSRLARMELLGLSLSSAGYYIIVWIGGGAIDAVTNTLTGLALATAPALLLAELSFRPFSVWSHERTSGTLPLLFLTPLSSREIVGGRLTAALLYAVSAHWPLLACGVMAAIHVAVTAPWGVWVGTALFLPLCALFWVAFGATARQQTDPPWKWRREDWHEVGLGFMALALLFATVGLFNYGGGPPEPAGLWFVVSPLMVGAGLWVVHRTYLIRLAQFEALRCGDWELNEK